MFPWGAGNFVTAGNCSGTSAFHRYIFISHSLPVRASDLHEKCVMRAGKFVSYGLSEQNAEPGNTQTCWRLSRNFAGRLNSNRSMTQCVPGSTILDHLQ